MVWTIEQSDNFNRANEDPATGWSQQNFTNGVSIVSNALVGMETYEVDTVYTTELSSADQASASRAVCAAGSANHIVMVRSDDQGQGGLEAKLSGQELYIDGAYTAGYAPPFNSYGANPVLRLEVVGTTWTFLIDGVFGATGTTAVAGGVGSNYAGMSATTTVTWDEWAGYVDASGTSSASGAVTDVRDATSGAATTNIFSLTATTFDDDRIDLAWNTVSGATGYDIERDSVVVVYAHATNSYSDTGLDPSTEYCYRVRAVF